MLRLVADNPLWIVLVAVTIAVHVGFAVALRRLFRAPPPPPPGSAGGEADDGRGADPAPPR